MYKFRWLDFVEMSCWAEPIYQFKMQNYRPHNAKLCLFDKLERTGIEQESEILFKKEHSVVVASKTGGGTNKGGKAIQPTQRKLRKSC